MFSIFLLLLLSIFDVANASSSQCVAIDSSNDSYACIDKQYTKHFPLVDTGVPQRISGSTAEQELIGDVITKMHDYFANEVLSRPEYAHVRNKCKNNHDLCAFWTSVGECETNRHFMQDNCAAACRLCLLASTNFEQGIIYY
mmetsp:Transcript_18293/g.29992  ORF Transcript_18293/g.29992 Transcript_18293/m.29992 type:complete len:142 (+) Transcript_18293:228-653(+)